MDGLRAACGVMSGTANPEAPFAGVIRDRRPVACIEPGADRELRGEIPATLVTRALIPSRAPVSVDFAESSP